MAEPSGRRGLGRGLSALLSEVEAPPVEVSEAAAPAGSGLAAVEGGGALLAPIELLKRNPDQPRKVFDETDLGELEESIRIKGILSPILVRPASGAAGEYQIVAGERRWRAAQRVGLHHVPILVRELDDLDVLEIGVIENVQRTDLNPIEEAQAYKTLMDRFGRTQDAVAKVVGKSRSHVANALRLLNLPEAVREHVLAGRLSAGHARAIISMDDPAGAAQTIIDRDLSVRQAEALSRGPVDRDASVRAVARAMGVGRGKDPDTRALESDLAEALGLAVEIDDRNGKGEIRIRYATLEQLDLVCRKLSGG